MGFNYYIGEANTLMFRSDGNTTWAMLATRDHRNWTIFADYGFNYGYNKRKQIPDLYVILKGKTP